jgi:hypothetical protein
LALREILSESSCLFFVSQLGLLDLLVSNSLVLSHFLLLDETLGFGLFGFQVIIESEPDFFLFHYGFSLDLFSGLSFSSLTFGFCFSGNFTFDWGGVAVLGARDLIAPATTAVTALLVTASAATSTVLTIEGVVLLTRLALESSALSTTLCTFNNGSVFAIGKGSSWSASATTTAVTTTAFFTFWAFTTLTFWAFTTLTLGTLTTLTFGTLTALTLGTLTALALGTITTTATSAASAFTLRSVASFATSTATATSSRFLSVIDFLESCLVGFVDGCSDYLDDWLFLGFCLFDSDLDCLLLGRLFLHSESFKSICFAHSKLS